MARVEATPDAYREKDKFLAFIAGTEFEETLKNLARVRDRETWNILSSSRVFQGLTSYQKTWLESVFRPKDFKATEVLLKEGDLFRSMYVVRSGTVEVIKNQSLVGELNTGDFIGNLRDIGTDQRSSYTYRARGGVKLFAVDHSDMVSFAEKNPGLIMKMSSEITD